MNRFHKLAQFLVSSWILAQENDKCIPTSRGVLDRALKDAVDDPSCPGWVKNELHFVDSRVGLQCVELPAILDWAQRAELTSAPNPSYRFTEVRISGLLARHFAQKLEISKSEAAKWGGVLRKKLDEQMAVG